MGITTHLTKLPERAAAHYAATGQPYVVLSYAQSLDSALARVPGQPTAISGPEALRWTHRLRAICDGIVIGVGTLLADDPQLTVRYIEGANPQPIVIDTHLRTPPGARLLHHPTHQLWVVTTAEVPPPPPAEAIRCPPSASGRVDLHAALAALGERGITCLMVEGGATILAAFLGRGLAHEALITIAPRWLGQGSLPLTPPVSTELNYTLTQPAGDDIMLWGVF